MRNRRRQALAKRLALDKKRECVRLWMRRLQYGCPLRAPVQIRLMDLSGQPHNGCWIFKGEKHLITLNVRGNLDVLQDTLIHEWAHALKHESAFQKAPDHGPDWGRCYARCYRAVTLEK